MILKSHVLKKIAYAKLSETHHRRTASLPVFSPVLLYLEVPAMSYYGNSNNNSSNNWNSRPGAIDEVDLSSGAYPPAPGSAPPAFGQPNQQPGQAWQRPPLVSDQIKDASTKQYNDFLEKQGIPSITPEDMEVKKLFCCNQYSTIDFQLWEYKVKNTLESIPNILLKLFQILRECGRESLYFRCK